MFHRRPDPRHPLRRRRHRARHRDAGRHRRPHGRFQAGPAPGGRPAAGLLEVRPLGPARGARALLGLDQRGAPGTHGLGDRGGRGARRPLRDSARAHPDRHVRVAYPPDPAGAGSGRALRTPGRPARQEHGRQRGRGLGAGLSDGPRGSARQPRRAGPAAREPSAHPLHREPGRDPLGRGAHRGRGAQVRPGRAGRPRDLLLAGDPRQRAGDRARDQCAAPARGRGAVGGRGLRPRLRSRQPGRPQGDAGPDAAALLRAGARRIPSSAPARPARRERGGPSGTTSSSWRMVSGSS